MPPSMITKVTPTAMTNRVAVSEASHEKRLHGQELGRNQTDEDDEHDQRDQRHRLPQTSLPGPMTPVFTLLIRRWRLDHVLDQIDLLGLVAGAGIECGG